MNTIKNNYFFVFYTNLVNEEQESEPTAISKVAQNSFLWHAQDWVKIYIRDNCRARVNRRSCRVIMLRNFKLMTSIFPLLCGSFFNFYFLQMDFTLSKVHFMRLFLEKFCQQKKVIIMNSKKSGFFLEFLTDFIF